MTMIYKHKRTAGLLSMFCITDTDGTQNSGSSIGAAQSVPLKPTQTDGDAVV